ncbi:MAG: MFS transporter [Thermoleophilia bacterium]
MAAAPVPAGPNRIAPMRFVLAFGVVSMLGDVVYEGARSVTGPLLADLGAGAALVGLVTGAGEAVALLFRLVAGPLSDRTGRHWPPTIAGYAITMISVPLLALAHALWSASALVIAERFGKAVRSPSKDTMLAEASVGLGRGRAFAIHEALDQVGALLGPLLVAAAIAVTGDLRWGFALLLIPGVAAMATVGGLRRAAPDPGAYERAHHPGEPAAPARLPLRFWLYAGCTTLNMAGFATFAVLAYHLQVRHVVSGAVIPIVYAAAMGAAAVAALAAGRSYDRIGLRGLMILPPLTAVVPFLSLSTAPPLIWTGALIWGAVLGVHESTMRAAVADIVPAGRRGTAYGAFAAVYGLAWLGGSALIGLLYARSATAVEVFVVITQALALPAFALLVARR